MRDDLKFEEVLQSQQDAHLNLDTVFCRSEKQKQQQQEAQHKRTNQQSVRQIHPFSLHLCSLDPLCLLLADLQVRNSCQVGDERKKEKKNNFFFMCRH